MCAAECTRAAAFSALAPAIMPSAFRCRSASSLYSARETVSTVSTWGVGEAGRWGGGEAGRWGGGECEGKAEAKRPWRRRRQVEVEAEGGSKAAAPEGSWRFSKPPTCSLARR